MMPSKTEKHLPLIKVLEMSDSKQRKAIINALDKSQINILCEICFLHGTLPVSKTILESLRDKKVHFRHIVNKTASLRKKNNSLIRVSDQLRTPLKLVLKRFSNTDQFDGSNKRLPVRGNLCACS